MLPEIIKEKTYNYFLVKIDYLVEDRHSGEAVPRYKHYITVRILWKTFNWTLRTITPYEDLPYTR